MLWAIARIMLWARIFSRCTGEIPYLLLCLQMFLPPVYFGSFSAVFHNHWWSSPRIPSFLHLRSFVHGVSSFSPPLVSYNDSHECSLFYTGSLYTLYIRILIWHGYILFSSSIKCLYKINSSPQSRFLCYIKRSQIFFVLKFKHFSIPVIQKIFFMLRNLDRFIILLPEMYMSEGIIRALLQDFSKKMK